MNMTPKSMSYGESNGEVENIVINLNSNLNEKNHNSSIQMNSLIKFKLEEFPKTISKRNKIRKRKSYYDDYIDRSSSNKSKKKKNTIESKSRIYECIYDDCRKIFDDKGSYRKHQLTHGEKQYLCIHPGCGRKFLDNSKLRRHTLVHTGEKPFRCELCGKKFSLDFNLRTHLRIHTGEKPYACTFPGCFKRFSQSSNLTAHEKTHVNQKFPLVPILPSNQQTVPTTKPIFSTNPLKFMINNQYSGTLNINNLNQINKLYEIMKEALLQDNGVYTTNVQSNSTNNIFSTLQNPKTNNGSQLVIFATTNTQNQQNSYSDNLNSNLKPNKLFTTINKKRIFNIIKEPNHNNRRKSVKIIYNEELSPNHNNQANLDYEYSDDVEERKQENYKEEQYYENNEDEYIEEEEDNKAEEGHHNIFDAAYPTFLNMFK